MSSKRILISPLDWGLGHATRLVPIIQEVLTLKHIPVLAGSGQSFEWLIAQFPDLEQIPIPGYPITYPKNGRMDFHFIRQFPKMHRFLKSENELCEQVVKKHNIDALISDNRYGIFSKKTPSVLLTHQLQLQVGAWKYLAQPYLISRLKKFDQVWVPDIEGRASLAGNLSKAPSGVKNPIHYIGPLSKFEPKLSRTVKKYDCLAIISGPEPQRSNFEKEILSELRTVRGRHAVVTGSTQEFNHLPLDHVDVFQMTQANELFDLIDSSEFLISRSGYSSIMDFYKLGRSAILVPTPNQPEQEYLAAYHNTGSQFVIQRQGQLNIREGILSLRKDIIRTIPPSGNMRELIGALFQ